MPRALRACWRVLRLLLHVLRGLWVVALRFPGLSPDQQQARVQAWSLGLLACAGVRLELRGRPAEAWPVLLVANKIDKVSKNQRFKSLAAIAAAMNVAKEEIICFSAVTREGKEQLQSIVQQYLLEQGQ